MKKNRAEQKVKLLTLYSLDEILVIMGYFEGQGSTAWDDDVQVKLESIEGTNGEFPTEFIDIVLEHAIDNGNFEEALKLGKRLPI